MRRRLDTTELLKESMGTALLELMKSKKLDKISIEEMTAKADVGRVTYYRHFKSKEDVLSFKYAMLWKRYSETNFEEGFDITRESIASVFFNFCISIRNTNDILYQAGLKNIILDAYINVMINNKAFSDIAALYKQNFMTYGLFGLVNAWILNGYQEAPIEMAKISLEYVYKQPIVDSL